MRYHGMAISAALLLAWAFLAAEDELPRPRDHHQPGRRARRCGARHKALILNERGLTLVEILVAAFIIGIGLVGLMSVVPISSYGLHEGNSLTRATFLAEQKMEEIKNAAWQQTPANDCVGVSAGNGNVAPTSTTCTRTNPTACASGGACPIAGDEAPVAGNTGYTRTVRIADCATVAGGCEWPPLLRHAVGESAHQQFAFL